MFADDEIEALRVYSGPRHRLINDHLRGDEDHGAEVFHHVRALDRALAKCPVGRDLVVYRGIDGDAAARLRAANLAVGDRFGDGAFVSTSADPLSCRLFASWPPGGLILRIGVKAGSTAIDMAPFSEHPDEREYLLPRDTLFEVTGISSGSPQIIDVEVCR